MVSKGELVAAFFEQRLSKNLEVFEKYLPDIYKQFENYKEERFFLIYDAEGNVNLFDRDDQVLKYGANPAAEILANYEAYKTGSAQRPFFCLGADPDAVVNPVHNRFLAGLGKVQYSLMEEVLGDHIEAEMKALAESIDGEAVSAVSSTMLLDDINSFVWISTGLGFDLEQAYKEKNIRRLYILEPNKDIFFASLQLIDWSAIIDKMLERNQSIYIGIAEENSELIADFSEQVFSAGRHNFAGSYFYSSFYLEGYEDIFEAIKKQVDLKILSGFGFYDDARLSFAHTLGNFKNKVPCITIAREQDRDVNQSEYPAFIIGNGPSIDSDIEFIRSNIGKSIVISCGTSLSTLYNNGIQPDIHVELERTADVVSFARNTSNDPKFSEYLQGIIFIGASQVHPDMFAMFKTCGQMPKDVEAGSVYAHKVLGDKRMALVGRIAPSCVHVGFSTAVILGYREIFLFGTDMGYFDRSYHHSKSSLYEDMNEESAEKYTPNEKGEMEFDANFFDEKVFSSGFLPLFKNELEISIAAWKDNYGDKLSVFNCSNGAKIEGAEPLRAEEIEFDVPEQDKAETLATVFESYFSYKPSSKDYELLRSDLEAQIDKVDEMCDWLLSRVVPVSTFEEADALVAEVSYEFHSDKSLVSDEDSWLFSLFDGTLLYGLSAINTVLYYPASDEKRIGSFNRAMEEFVKFVKEVKEDFRGNSLVYDLEENYNYF